MDEQPWSGLLRILLAEEDDVQAFMLHCELNRLARASTFERARSSSDLAEKLDRFAPTHLILAGEFATPNEIIRIRAKSAGILIICFVASETDAPAALKAGANDCLLQTQCLDLPACIEAHLEGRAAIPFYKIAAARSGRLESIEQALTGFDEKIVKILKSRAHTVVQQAREIGRKLSALGAAAQNRLRSWSGTIDLSEWFARERHLNSQWLELHAGVAAPYSQRLSPDHFADSHAENASGSLTNPTICPFERVSDEEVLRDLDLSLKILFHSTFDALYLLDCSGTILHLNQPGAELLGCPSETLPGRRFIEFVAAADIPKLLRNWETLLTDGHYDGGMRILSASNPREISFSARANLWFGIHLLVARESALTGNSARMSA